ncbi:unnamed protein product [Durusdinium trenchii]|uniref:Uncharacterized protein n=1 Tax=Durusdinium trenchii TaxID=1381693 RepID=A0ABP0HQ32_9DINO
MADPGVRISANSRASEARPQNFRGKGCRGKAGRCLWRFLQQPESRNTLYLKIYTRVPQVMCREAQTDLGAQTECEELGPQAGQEKRKANLRFAENRDVDGQLVVPKASACVPQSAGLGWSSTFRSVH